MTSPTDIRSIAVHADDVVRAYESNQRAGKAFVLRLTPPFHGKMRARLHDGRVRNTDRTITIEPVDLLDQSAIPPYPTVAESEDALRADPDETFSTARHRAYHVERIRRWRSAARAAIVDAIAIDVLKGPVDEGGRSETIRVITLRRSVDEETGSTP